MKVVGNLGEAAGLGRPVVTIGMFDGIHLGHQRVLRNLVERARLFGTSAVVLSFVPHPQKVISSRGAPPLIQTFEQQAELLEKLGVDIYLRLPFTRHLSLLQPREFVEQVLLGLGAREVHIGRNFRFGHRRSGDFDTLRELGRVNGFEVQPSPVADFRGERVSSTRIRRLVSVGRVGLAARLLGRPFEMTGSIVKGARRGVELGFPTANLKPDNELVPATGVYATQARVNGSWLTGATNIGFRPTLNPFSEPHPTVETHLLDFSGDLYGQTVRLRFCLRLREERRFENVSALIEQVRKDILWTARYHDRLRRREREVDQQRG